MEVAQGITITVMELGKSVTGKIRGQFAIRPVWLTVVTVEFMRFPDKLAVKPIHVDRTRGDCGVVSH
jgi:hypothetical protein